MAPGRPDAMRCLDESQASQIVRTARTRKAPAGQAPSEATGTKANADRPARQICTKGT
jgi:hypothetical protein